MGDLVVTTSEAVTLFASTTARITRQHIRDWARPSRKGGPLLHSRGRCGKEAVWSWADLLHAEKVTRARRGHYAHGAPNENDLCIRAPSTDLHCNGGR